MPEQLTSLETFSGRNYHRTTYTHTPSSPFESQLTYFLFRLPYVPISFHLSHQFWRKRCPLFPWPVQNHSKKTKNTKLQLHRTQTHPCLLYISISTSNSITITITVSLVILWSNACLYHAHIEDNEQKRYCPRFAYLEISQVLKRCGWKWGLAIRLYLWRWAVFVFHGTQWNSDSTTVCFLFGIWLARLLYHDWTYLSHQVLRWRQLCWWISVVLAELDECCQGLFAIPRPRVPGTALLFMQGFLSGYEFIDLKKDQNDKLYPNDEKSFSCTHGHNKPNLILEESEKPISPGPDLSKCINICRNMFST